MLNLKYIPVLQYTTFLAKDNGQTSFCTTIEKFSKDMTLTQS